MLFNTTSSDYRQYMAGEGHAPSRTFAKPEVAMEFNTTASDYRPPAGQAPPPPAGRPAMEFQRTSDDFASAAVVAAAANKATKRWEWQQQEKQQEKPAMDFGRTSDSYARHDLASTSVLSRVNAALCGATRRP